MAVVLLFLGIQAKGQYANDIINFSQERKWGTARFQAMGNAQTALGGDISAASANPAGLGFFSSSDLSLTFNYLNNANKASFLGNSQTTNKGRFAIDQAGIVLHMPTYKQHGRTDQGWLNFNVGLNYSRSYDFTNEQVYQGMNGENSIVNSYVDFMDYNSGDLVDDLYGAYLADERGDGQGYYPVVRDKGDKLQNHTLTEKGFRSSTDLAFGANYSNKFYIGGSLSMVSIQYEKNSSFAELDGRTKSRQEILNNNSGSELADPNSDNYFVDKYYDLYDELQQKVDASGYNFSLGMIYKPASDWNIGVNFTSPTWLTVMDDSYEIRDVYYYDNAQDNDASLYSENNYEYPFEYDARTPLRVGIGVAKFFSGGLISADIDYIDYSSAKFRTLHNDFSFEDDNNQEIKSTYKNAINARIGGEILLTPVFSARAGFNYMGNPYKYSDQTNIQGSLGLGARISNNLYADLSLLHGAYSYKENPYVIDEGYWGSSSPIADISRQQTSAVLTLGVKF